MLKLLGARPLGDRDLPEILAVFGGDPVASCMVAARVEEHGTDPRKIHGELWSRGGATQSLCFSGANLVPLRGSAEDVRAFADRAARAPRTCSSLVGRAELTLPLWAHLEFHWGPAREVRAEQPLLALTGAARCLADSRVRRVRLEELDSYLPAAVAMFTEEVGVDPRAHDGGRAYRRRVESLVRAGRAFARFEDGEVVFKAEIGSMSRAVGQIQGVWVVPERRGEGLGSAGTATVARAIVDSGRAASLYVNSFNTPARAAYARIGFEQVATFATILLD
ncbi:GNAT family N-acetyltransferase [Rhodococcus rhodnii]|uniref:Acetyltransferase n=2 Tax=Rhodococcus rhodnii TaxID=38312 RepID=R7WL18_9NOCA|nr:GNAT family N-acetyltransferase [Rhodococcus rhodnii]EOM76011.1 acetyltransferase [Rhodococcus rhodnii LMG 5362]TXG90850.1 GNAT family N-acetyltransferase [Rhodococcus rhodnii]